MDCSEYLTVLALLVSIVALGVVFLAYTEYIRVRSLRSELEAWRAAVEDRLYRNAKAQQRIQASYHVASPEQKIALIESALTADPDTFNGYNALGWARMAQEDIPGAIAAFEQAVLRHPKDKAGYFDLAWGQLQAHRPDRARKALQKAIQVDASSREDIEEEPELADLFRENDNT
ncbi:tetratricopeptide repeat protein [Ectothiorhodospira mobilis]|uniref:tetratricopeptide repeat protein n=1 Tax=Ectothiorhodospira mobilis TaxID=195064 RepID=UPI0019036E6F|nr:tetratricopeptide repeat protein [Ectothiorhodospira mobilis]MBK1692000.1 hypothetical protein [Ectothiorhodospira mobilis]